MSNIKKTAKKTVNESKFVLLIESELEKAEVVLAAKGITDKLGKVATELVSLEGDDILPMLDTITAAFGQLTADAFKNVAVDNLRKSAEAITAAKSAIDVELSKLEAILNGEPAPEVVAPAADAVKNDMAANAGVDASADVPDAGIDASLGDDADLGADSDLGDDFGDNSDMDSSFAGRARKESVERRGRLIAEAEMRAAGSDAVVLRAFRAMIKEGASGPLAARAVARHYGIDVSDIVEIVREAFEAGKRFPLLHKNSLMSKNSTRVNEAKKSTKDDDHKDDCEKEDCKDDGKKAAFAKNKFVKGGKKLKEDTTPPETIQPPNPSDLQKAKTLATKIKATAPGGTVPLNKVGSDIEQHIGAVGKSAADIGAMSPLVTKELDGMGAIKESDDESPVVGDSGHDAFASWLDNRHNTLMSKVMGGSVDEECEESPVPKPTDIDTGRKNKMFSKTGKSTVPSKEFEKDAPKFSAGSKRNEVEEDSFKGKHHREMGVPSDKKIPTEKMQSATRSRDPEVARDAKRTETTKKWNHKR